MNLFLVRNPFLPIVRFIKEELQKLGEPGSYVGEVIKVMGKKKVLVKVQPEGKYVVEVSPNIDITTLVPNTRVALKNEAYELHLILPNKVDPLVSLMKVEKVPNSTYEEIGGCDKQIKEIKEVIELPIKHPELFEALGIAQPKGVLMYGYGISFVFHFTGSFFSFLDRLELERLCWPVPWRITPLARLSVCLGIIPFLLGLCSWLTC